MVLGIHEPRFQWSFIGFLVCGEDTVVLGLCVPCGTFEVWLKSGQVLHALIQLSQVCILVVATTGSVFVCLLFGKVDFVLSKQIPSTFCSFRFIHQVFHYCSSFFFFCHCHKT